MVAALPGGSCGLSAVSVAITQGRGELRRVELQSILCWPIVVTVALRYV